jgi:hypothetical protein
MATQEITRGEWEAFFDSFSRRHQGWLVTVEVMGADIGAQVEARRLPLEWIAAEMKNDDGLISIIVGDQAETHFTHMISKPSHVRLKKSEESADEALEIESADGTVTLVRFRSAVLPEVVDGIP